MEAAPPAPATNTKTGVIQQSDAVIAENNATPNSHLDALCLPIISNLFVIARQKRGRRFVLFIEESIEVK